MNIPFILGVLLLIGLFTTVIATNVSFASKDSANNTKLLSAVIAYSIAGGIIGFLLGIYYFSYNVEYLAIFLLALVMLVCVPGTLIAIGISTVTVSNLRDTLASGK